MPDARQIPTPSLNVVDLVAEALCCQGPCMAPDRCHADIMVGPDAARVISVLRKAKVLTDV